jgi:cyclopropane fatty-acyl-phospholipid synthase-like methyltransferase
MSGTVDLYGTAYGNFSDPAIEQVRRETYGEDFGQSSWVTGDEYRRFFRLLGLNSADHVLDTGCGSGGPAHFVAREIGCRVTGIDVDEAGIRAAEGLARQFGMTDKLTFRHADVAQPLPFADSTFDAIVSMDALCHFPNRSRLFAEWLRVLRPGGRLLVTDPVVVTGLVTKEELALRSSTGHFEFCPPGVNERALQQSGFELVTVDDVTENAAQVSGRWHDGRERRSDELRQLEGDETFFGLQRFLATVHLLTRERRLSRFVYLARKPEP